LTGAGTDTENLSWLSKTFGPTGQEGAHTLGDLKNGLEESQTDGILKTEKAVPKPGADEEENYLTRSIKQIVLGNFTDDVTLAGTLGQVALGLLGVDLPMDVRDLTYDLLNWQWSWGHAGQTLLDAIGLVPGIGIVKNADEVGAVLKSAFSNGDEIAALLKAVAKDPDGALALIGQAAGNPHAAAALAAGGAKAADELAGNSGDVGKAAQKNT
jgi:hypothetical protein